MQSSFASLLTSFRNFRFFRRLAAFLFSLMIWVLSAPMAWGEENLKSTTSSNTIPFNTSFSSVFGFQPIELEQKSKFVVPNRYETFSTRNDHLAIISTAKVAGSFVNVRIGPHKNLPSHLALLPDQEVVFIGQYLSWFQIQADVDGKRQRGWIHNDQLNEFVDDQGRPVRWLQIDVPKTISNGIVIGAGIVEGFSIFSAGLTHHINSQLWLTADASSNTFGWGEEVSLLSVGIEFRLPSTEKNTWLLMTGAGLLWDDAQEIILDTRVASDFRYVGGGYEWRLDNNSRLRFKYRYTIIASDLDEADAADIFQLEWLIPIALPEW
ncbi:MAG: hypothetical protein V4629_08950 [Pseudomonadota bacterium]